MEWIEVESGDDDSDELDVNELASWLVKPDDDQEPEDLGD